MAQLDMTQVRPASAMRAAAIKAAAGLGFGFTAASPEAMSAVAAARAVRPGKERWPVKTGQDPDVAHVGLDENGSGPVFIDATVEELRRLQRPTDMQQLTSPQPLYQERRAIPVETTIWRLTAMVTAIKNEDDGDMHLALQGDSGETMVAESVRPDADFIGAGNAWSTALDSVRTAVTDAALVAQLARVALVQSAGKLLPVASFASAALAAAAGPRMNAADALAAGMSFQTRIDPRKARLTGVGLFDRVHDQIGVAITNGIELHPVLAFEWLS